MKRLCLALFVAALFLAGSRLAAHPGSGIAVDQNGVVYFVDTGSGVWMINPEGTLTRLSAPAYHWMAFDGNRRLADVTLPYLARGNATVARDTEDPRILVSSDFPIAVGDDGSLYYPWLPPADRLKIFRVTPSGHSSVVASLSPQLRWLNGIDAAPDGSIYFSEDKAIRRITPEGELRTFVDNLTLPGCESVPGIGPELGPYFRDLDVDSTGTVYVAATGCRAVLKITPGREITTVLQTSGPWSPTAVAVSGNNLFVLEYLHTPTDNRREWLPRVRKVSPDGSVITLATIDRR